jgi:oligopeptide transport system substrate-binding protein
VEEVKKIREKRSNLLEGEENAMKGKLFFVIALLMTASFVLTACGGTGAVQTIIVTEIVEGEVVEIIVEVPAEVEGDDLNTLYYNWSTEPPTADPSLATDTTSSNVIGSIFTGLTDQNLDTLETIPALATSWTSSEDKITWTFELRDDVPWVQYNPTTGEIAVVTDDEGNPRMTNADDVVYGVKRTCDPNTASDYAWLVYIISGCEALNTADPDAEDFQEIYDAMGVVALDDYTVEFTLEYGAGYFPAILTMANLFPTYQPIIEEKGDRWIEPGFIVSNGAYVMEEWVHGDHLTLLKNPNWPMWGTDVAAGNIERIVGYTIEEQSTAFAMYENDELDTAEVPLDQIDYVKADPVLSEEFYNAPSNCTYYYGFITERDAVSDVKVRKALSMGIDRVTLVEEITKGGQQPANSFTNPMNFGTVAFDTDIAPWALPEDMGGTGYAAAVEEANALLAEAGFPDGEGLDIQLMHNVSESHARIAQAIQAMWSEAFPGMNASVETQEWRVYLDTIRASTDVNDVPDVYRLGWCGDYPHANNWMLEVFHPEVGSNRVRFSVDDPQVGDLIQEYMDVTEAAQVADPAEAETLYKRAEQLLVDEIVGMAPIYFYTRVLVEKPELTRTYDQIKMHFFEWMLAE